MNKNASPFCPGCYYLSKQLKATIHYQHMPGDCPRKALAIKMFQVEDGEHFKVSSEDYDSSGKALIKERENISSTCLSTFQTNPDKLSESLAHTEENMKGDRIQSVVENKYIQSLTEGINLSTLNPECISDEMISKLQLMVSRLGARQENWNIDGVRKSKSPCILVQIETVQTPAIIDEGSEINCMDYAFAVRHKIQFTPTKCVAYAAGSTNINLEGETRDSIKVQALECSSPVMLHLGKMVVVRNLGIDLLIGEPGKKDNSMVTYPNKRRVEVESADEKRFIIPYISALRSQHKVYHCKANKKEVVYPGQSLRVKLPIQFQESSHVNVVGANQSQYSWVPTKILQVDNEGYIVLHNENKDAIKLSKHEHYATVTPCAQTTLKDLRNGAYVSKIYDLNRNDLSHLIPMRTTDTPSENFLSDISVDPDNILSSAWKQKFYNVCRRFSHIITPRPGKYNGFYGRIDNSINFASKPPPSIRAHLPKYSHDMLKIMGEKMDKLEEWGVLVKPEDIGVVPEFVLPSMLLPKPEKNEWRLVTDFTPLNLHIKKLETTSPTINEAKRKLAKFKYHIQMDLSNYFYQGGMKVEDCQYLATPHPFKGLRVYICEPQGLKNASEHAYERLGLIYGDLCAEEKMTRMADGLFILSDTLEGLKQNFEEVLSRAELCGLTLKPSKLIIAPYKTVIFGWQKIGCGWSPTSHVVSPLIKADLPITVKQARSWIGAYKQLTECIPRYAILLGPLEKLLAGKASAEHINWTDELTKQFEKCKKSLNDIRMIYVPKPTDVLHTWSDYSASEMAVGGRLELHRTENGITKKLLGGHFSCRVNRHQQRWYPCEGEALAVRLVLEHFLPYIRENKHPTIHHTDNQPVVQAWRRSKVGAFSTSARISTFLSGVSSMNVEIVHTPGKDMQASDYNSRHPQTCQESRCQICQFALEMEQMGDNVAKISVQDVEQGSVNMPFIQRSAWVKVQKNDKVHQQLDLLIKTSQSPEKKKTGGDNTTLKRLHNLFKKGLLKQASDGLVTISQTDPHSGAYQAISVPIQIFPGLVQALHLKFNHPSKLQLLKLINRYFYCPGSARMVEEVMANCLTCTSLKQLPDCLFSESTSKNTIFGQNFSADIIRANGQKILLCREKLSQFTMTKLLRDETADSIRSAIIVLILEFIPDSGASVQVDCATAFQTLSKECSTEGSTLKNLGIKIIMGRTVNTNKNPVAENAIKEYHKERLRLDPAGGCVNESQLAIITHNINSRIRFRGLSSKEIAFRRDQVTNQCKDSVNDDNLAEEQFNTRVSKHNKVPPTNGPMFSIGDNVFLRNDSNKSRGREMYKITDIFNKQDERWAKLQKTETQFRAKEYEVKQSEIIPIIDAQGNDRDYLDDTVIEIASSSPTSGKDSTRFKNPDTDQDVTGSDVECATVRHKNSEVTHYNGVRPQRKTAAESRAKITDLAAQGLLNIKSDPKNVKLKNKTPTHAWEWDDFNALCNMDNDFCGPRNKGSHSLRRNNGSRNILCENIPHDDAFIVSDNSNTTDNSQDVFDEYWDNSVKQYQLSTPDYNLESIYRGSSLVFHSSRLFSPDRTEDADQMLSARTRLDAVSTNSSIKFDDLTSESSDGEVFPILDSQPITRSALKRGYALRRKKRLNIQNSVAMVQDTATLYAPRIPTPSSPDKVLMHQVQDLSQALSLRRPIASEVVSVENNCALFLDQALPVTSPLTRHAMLQQAGMKNNTLP